MQGRQEVVLETLRRVQHFLDDNPTTLDAVNKSGARRRLDETVARMTAHAVAQVGGSRTAEGETARQAALRQSLRFDHMRPIAVIAEQKLREQPEFKLLRLPAWEVRGARLTAAARDMANGAEKYTELFVDEGLAPDFVAELRAATDRLDQSIDARGRSQGQRAGATEGLRVETKRGRALIRLLDSLVRPKLAGSDELLREWSVARHVKRARTPLNAASQDGQAPAPAAAPGANSTPEVAPRPGATVA